VVVDVVVVVCDAHGSVLVVELDVVELESEVEVVVVWAAVEVEAALAAAVWCRTWWPWCKPKEDGRLRSSSPSRVGRNGAGGVFARGERRPRHRCWSQLIMDTSLAKKMEARALQRGAPPSSPVSICQAEIVDSASPSRVGRRR
jgi:hypothetical protein